MNTVRLTFRIEDEMLHFLRHSALANKRSINGELNAILKKAFYNSNKKNKHEDILVNEKKQCKTEF